MSALQFLLRIGVLARSRGGLISAPWILADGTWNDAGRWDDAARWTDAPSRVTGGSLAAALSSARLVAGTLSASLEAQAGPSVNASTFSDASDLAGGSHLWSDPLAPEWSEAAAAELSWDDLSGTIEWEDVDGSSPINWDDA